MSAGKVEAIDALNFAARLEREGKAHYLKTAGLCPNPKGKTMYETLAKQKQAHLDLIEHTKETYSKMNLWPDQTKVSEELKASYEAAKIFQPVAASQLAADEKAALKQAMEAEKKSADFYQTWATRADYRGAQNMFKALVEEETRHLQLLQYYAGGLVK